MTASRVVMSVVVLLGLFALGGLAGTIYLIDHEKAAESVAVVSGLTGTALGALGAVLASTKSGPDAGAAPLPVTVENVGAGEAVPVEQVPPAAPPAG